MDKLMSLQTIVTNESNKQEEEIFHLMQIAILENKNFILYETHEKIHPFVYFILSSKGYKIENMNKKHKDQKKKYYITT